MPLRMTEGISVPARRLTAAGPTPAAPETARQRTAARRARRVAGARQQPAKATTTKSAESAKPARSVKSAKSAKSSKSARSANSAKSVKPMARPARAKAGAGAAREHKLEVPRRPQQQADWCWAACVDMVLHFYDRRAVRQCEIVGRKLRREDCCADARNEQFSVPCAPESMRGVWRAWGCEARPHLPRKGRLGWVSEAALRRELDEGRPVEVGFSWDGGGGHAVVVYGWREGHGGTTYFYVNDPWNWADDPRDEFFAEGVGQVSYEELRAAYGVGRWKWTWTGIRRKG